MAIINLRDYYPFYTSDCFMEVLRTYRAYYSLMDDGDCQSAEPNRQNGFTLISFSA